ncbi:lytic transglycosylase domain-containing protein [Pseudoduganella aquatica]|uniref:lytic transglycosylase domain-containing protein n=1 Tax=Pseudoduganella aquatica TaxID=2660641 RepID=UPI001E46FA62|nr:transglycosylase SLT domain-containing protein [Pseudoduganella aquatica]
MQRSIFRHTRAARAGALAALLSAQLAALAAEPAAELLAAAARLEHGEGVPRDLPQALALYCRAARLGDAQAQYALGWMLANGRGAPRDDGAASQLFALAAAQGHPQAQAMLHMTNTAPGTPLPACLLPDTPLVAMPPEPRVLYTHAASKQIGALVEVLAPQFDVDPRLAMAIIAIESGFNARAVSPKNAQGLMQLIPETAERFRVKDAFDPEQNIRGGLAYLRWLLAYFRGDVQLVAAAYNAGEKAVDQYKGVPPYAETQEYVKRLARLYKHAVHPYPAGSAASGALRKP